MSTKTYTTIPDEQIKRTKKEKNTHSQTSRLENTDFSLIRTQKFLEFKTSRY
jgi:hypothetical protein